MTPSLAWIAGIAAVALAIAYFMGKPSTPTPSTTTSSTTTSIAKTASSSVLYIAVPLALVLLFAFFYLSRPDKGEIDAQTLVAGTQAGTVKTTQRVQLPLSLNEPEGITFSYSMWLLVKDFTTGYGTDRVILKKGDNCPGIYLDSTSNALSVRVNTYGITDSILISNIPALKWIHLGLVVDQQSVDVYINGTLRQHHTLSQLPDQNEDPVEIGGNWNGVVGNVVYYPRSLSYGEINAIASAEPPPYQDQVIGKKNYFDITWYIGRLNSA
jgi:hypothetical protein